MLYFNLRNKKKLCKESSNSRDFLDATDDFWQEAYGNIHDNVCYLAYLHTTVHSSTVHSDCNLTLLINIPQILQWIGRGQYLFIRYFLRFVMHDAFISERGHNKKKIDKSSQFESYKMQWLVIINKYTHCVKVQINFMVWFWMVDMLTNIYL